MPPLELLGPEYQIQLFMTGFFSMLVVGLIVGFVCWGVIVLMNLFKKITGR
jgi:uncharacterized membrane protein